jgi:hypothetical protein
MTGDGAGSFQAQPPPPRPKIKPAPPAGPPPPGAYVMHRKPFDKGTAKDIPAPPEMLPAPPKDPPTDFMRTVSDDYVAQKKMRQKAQEEAIMQKPPADWVLWVGEWLVGAAVFLYIAMCCFYITVYGMKLRTQMVIRVYVASAVGVGELYLVFETVKCVVIALVQLMVYKSNTENHEITRRKIRMLEKKQHLEKRQAGMKTLLVQPSGAWLWRKS